ncbi:MAG: cytochrome P450 [Acidimicrobiales bacterium]
MSEASLPSPPLRRQPSLIRRLFQKPVAVLDEVAERYGPLCGFGAGPVRVAVVGDPAALREMFGLPADAFRWGHKFNVLGFVVGKRSLIVADGDDHTRRRGAVQPAFTRRRLNHWIPTIIECTDQAIDRLEAALPAGGAVVDLYPLGREVVLEITVRSLFGERLASRTGRDQPLNSPRPTSNSGDTAVPPPAFPGTLRGFRG